MYEFLCNKDRFDKPSMLIRGVTKTTLFRRLALHNASGALKTHYNKIHNRLLFRENLEENMNIIRRENYFYRLYITETLIIQSKNQFSTCRLQDVDQTLKLTSHQPQEQQQPTGSSPAVPQ